MLFPPNEKCICVLTKLNQMSLKPTGNVVNMRLVNHDLCIATEKESYYVVVSTILTNPLLTVSEHALVLFVSLFPFCTAFGIDCDVSDSVLGDY